MTSVSESEHRKAIYNTECEDQQTNHPPKNHHLQLATSTPSAQAPHIPNTTHLPSPPPNTTLCNLAQTRRQHNTNPPSLNMSHHPPTPSRFMKAKHSIIHQPGHTERSHTITPCSPRHHQPPPSPAESHSLGHTAILPLQQQRRRIVELEHVYEGGPDCDEGT